MGAEKSGPSGRVKGKSFLKGRTLFYFLSQNRGRGKRISGIYGGHQEWGIEKRDQKKNLEGYLLARQRRGRKLPQGRCSEPSKQKGTKNRLLDGTNEHMDVGKVSSNMRNETRGEEAENVTRTNTNTKQNQTREG